MALRSLKQSDLNEVRHYRHPPDGVVILMNAICRLFNYPCNWESGKQLLGQPNFLQVVLYLFIYLLFVAIFWLHFRKIKQICFIV